MSSPSLTPNQRIGLVAWMLGLGYGLTEAQIRSLGQLRSRDQVRRMVAVISQVAHLDHDDCGLWSWDCCSLTAPETWRRDPTRERRHDPHERERAAWVSLTLARYGEVSTRQLGEQLGISRQAAFRLLDSLSIVLPIYVSDRARGVWAVLDMKELED